jgi:phosphopantetheinyl transferase (holo-ACP synthase)
MALIYHNSGPLGQHIAVWSISETYDELVLFLNNESFLKEIQNLGLKSALRINQKITAGILLQHVLKEDIQLYYDELGKPHLKDHKGFISISNTKESVAVIYHPNYPVGIDIEYPSERILKIAPKFLNIQEQNWINNSQMPFHNKCFVVWCVKEALFKLIGGGGIDFKDHILVNEPINNVGKLHFSKLGQEGSFTYHLISVNDLLISYIVGN